jgi:hypothetical protein
MLLRKKIFKYLPSKYPSDYWAFGILGIWTIVRSTEANTEGVKIYFVKYLEEMKKQSRTESFF